VEEYFEKGHSLIRLLLVNRMPLICNVIEEVLENQTDMQVVGKASSIEEGAKKAVLNLPDIVLISARLPGDGALKLTKSLTSTLKDVKILIFGTPASKEHVINFVEAGAAGCIFQNDSVACLLNAIRAALKEEALFSPDIVAALIARLSRITRSLDGDIISLGETNLTAREQEVLELMAMNLSNKEIAEQLCIQLGTVKNHVHKILHKLGVKSREEAASYRDSLRGNSS
jgi:two-component system, NarL family, nitrate/nitrite response regulator NarL